ncbi:hypothetical protein OUZ56_004327 [Daphnia magna]|uniref:Uncharacterized protein n=1 Tax=Daphnia magna TaxID=35525 RepID=A0ABQ9YPF1_9CRUS|nr:hypothetical protein OUZ56_004327 [Daphnia magna]
MTSPYDFALVRLACEENEQNCMGKASNVFFGVRERVREGKDGTKRQGGVPPGFGQRASTMDRGENMHQAINHNMKKTKKTNGIPIFCSCCFLTVTRINSAGNNST